MNWHKISVDKANEIIALNRKGEKVSCLEDFEEEEERISESKIFENVVGQDSLTRFDKPKSKINRKRNNQNKSKSKNKNRNQTINKKPNQNRKPKKNA